MGLPRGLWRLLRLLPMLLRRGRLGHRLRSEMLHRCQGDDLRLFGLLLLEMHDDEARYEEEGEQMSHDRPGDGQGGTAAAGGRQIGGRRWAKITSGHRCRVTPYP